MPLYSETVAFLSPGWRELVPAGHTDALVPGTRVLASRPLTTMLVEDEQEWLESSAPWVSTALDGGDDVLRSALLDLRALSVGLPVSVAGWSDRWRYAWPRDVSFVATALARIGHPEHAAQQLAFLQEVQRQDGVFEARYDPATRRTPDERVAQLDGSAWVVWGAHQLALAAPDRAVELSDPPAVDARAQRHPPDVRDRPADPTAEGLVRLLGARRASGDAGHGGVGARGPAQRHRAAAARG